MKTSQPTKTKPAFGIIAPTAYLTKFSTQSSFHLTLAHLIDSIPEYAQFYTERSKLGDYVIMDCSTFELGASFPPEQLLALATKTKADAIVLPDYPGQAWQRTVWAGEALVNEVKSAGFHTFFAPQSLVGDLEGWIEGYLWASENDDIDIIGMSILAIPNALPHIPKAYARVVMTQLLIDRGIFNFNKYHHFLGLNSAPNVELPALIKMDALDSCDSSNPVWCGVNGIKYDTTCTDFMNPSKKYLRHVDFNQPLVGQHLLDLVQYNINVTLNIIQHPENY